MGPFAAAYLAYKKGEVRSKQEMPSEVMLWILALGGAGIVVGLATYGYKIMNARRGVVDASLETRRRGAVSTPDPRRPWASSSPPSRRRAARASSWVRLSSSSTGRARAGRSVPLIARSVRRWQLGCLLCGNQPASPRHRTGVASMAWMSTRRFSANAP